jgi:DNA-binding winged helix-turn-helix (wHTH) protein
LTEIGLPDIKVHAGYQLRVQTLGAFRAWRAHVEIEPREWQRDKARQLFQLFIAERGRWLQRDEIVETLWPHLNAESATRDFKVALNALNRALEPNRAADAPFVFIVREGTAYRLRPEADLWLDSAARARSAARSSVRLPIACSTFSSIAGSAKNRAFAGRGLCRHRAVHSVRHSGDMAAEIAPDQAGLRAMDQAPDGASLTSPRTKGSLHTMGHAGIIVKQDAHKQRGLRFEDAERLGDDAR